MSAAHYHLKHVTKYRYHFPVSVSHHAIYLEPKTGPNQKCLSFQLTSDPIYLDFRRRTDFFGNAMGLFSIQEEHKELSVTAESEVEVSRMTPKVDAFSDSLESVLSFSKSKSMPLEVEQYLYGSRHIPDPCFPIQEIAKGLIKPGLTAAQYCWNLMEWMHSHFKFDGEATDIGTPVEEFLRLKRGVCQDFAHFMITALSSVGIAARYVSGYILTHPPEGEERMEGADASHAWVSAYIPEYGWLDMDPLNFMFCGDQHVTVAWGRDFGDVSVLRGAVNGGGNHELDIAVTMTPLAIHG